MSHNDDLLVSLYIPKSSTLDGSKTQGSVASVDQACSVRLSVETTPVALRQQ